MNKPKAAGRIVQWVIELRKFDIKYHPSTTIKAQVLADFITKFKIPDKEKAQDEVERWTIQTNELSAQKRGGLGVIIITPKKDTFKYGIKFQFPVTNIEVEYNAILTRLRVGKALGARNLLLQSDSQLVTGQDVEIPSAEKASGSRI